MMPTDYFNRAAATYDNHCALQTEVGNHLILLAAHYYHKQGNVLDIGCGTGIVTEQLAQKFDYNECHAIDAADSLLKNAHQRLKSYSVQTHLADFNQPLLLKTPFDLLFSNLALHWSNDLLTTLQMLGTLQHKKGILAFSIPTFDTFHELSPTFARMDFLSSAEITHLLQLAGYKLLTCSTETYSLSFSTTIDALRSIKQVGTNYVKHRLARGLRGRDLLNEKPIRTLSYVISYFVAECGE